MKARLVLAALLLALGGPPTAHAANQDFGGSLVIAGDGSNDIITVGGTSVDAGSADLAFARVNPDGSFDTGSGGGDGRAVNDLGGAEGANDVAAGPGSSFTFTGTSGNENVVIGRIEGGLGLDPSCAGDGADVVDLGGAERGDLVAVSPSGIFVAGVRNGVGFVIRFKADCTFDATFGVRELDFGAEGVVVEVHDIIIDPVTGEVTLAVELATDAGVVVLEGDGDPDLTFGGNGLYKQDLGTSFDRFTGLVPDGGQLIVVGGDGANGETVRIDATGMVVTGPVSFAIGPGGGAVNGVAAFGNGNLLNYGNVPGTGVADAAAALTEPVGFTLVPTFAGDGNNSFDPGSGLNTLTDGAALNGFAVVGGIADNTATQSFDVLLGAIGQDGVPTMAFNNGQFLLIDFTGQTNATGAGGGSAAPPPADLSVVLGAGEIEEGNTFDPTFNVGLGQRTTLRLTMFATLGASVSDAEVVVVLPDGFVLDRASLGKGDFDSCTPSDDGTRIVCRKARVDGAEGPTRVGMPYRADFMGHFTRRGDVFATAVVNTPVPDGKPDNNGVRADLTVVDVPDTTIGGVTPSQFMGTARTSAANAFEEVMRLAPAGIRAPRIRRVDIALLKGKARRNRCSWLRNRRLSFRRRSCARPIWLKAKGTRRWRYKLARSLKGGRYTLYARASNARGVSERVFTPRDGNRRSFAVRRR